MLPIKKTIEKNFPGFVVNSGVKLGEGWMSTVFEINGEWAFRFARNQRSSKDLEKEIQILPYLNSIISFNIPKFDFVGKQENGLKFVGYRMLPGILLEEDSILIFSENDKDKLIISLAEFMTDIQSISTSLAESKGVPVVDLKSVFLELYESAIEKVFPLFDNDIKRYIATRFDEYLKNIDYHSYEPKLIHGDLSPNHFLIDAETKRLTGIIDFGDMSICDPDYEYLYILEDCGRGFTHALLKVRGHAHPEKCLEKISLFVTFDQVRYILEGMERGIDSWVAEGLAEIQAEMNIAKG